MDSAGFDPNSWYHWLLLGCFIGVSIWGLSLSWQWRTEAKVKRERAKVARRLAMELHGVDRLPSQEQRRRSLSHKKSPDQSAAYPLSEK